MSATWLLCGFGPIPFWTWDRFQTNPRALREWLSQNVLKLRGLAFGNHRKYESKEPAILWSVIESFHRLVQNHGGRPAGLFDYGLHEVPTPAAGFRLLYNRLRPLRRFGRTGRFDLLIMLRDLGLIDAEPDSCFLKGATGPLAGARRVWGKLPVSQLDGRAAELSRRLGIPPHIIEDALCIWQKG